MDRVRLASPELDFWVEVRFHCNESRWLAVAMISGEPVIGIGPSPLAATQSALAQLGPYASGLLLEEWQHST